MTIHKNLLPLLLLVSSCSASFFPFLGCKDELSWSVPAGSDCYAVDSSLCEFADTNGCQQITGSYLYYLGGTRRDGGQTYVEEIYQSVAISAEANCKVGVPRNCTIEVGGQSCTGCSNTDPTNYKIVTLTDCSNLAGSLDAAPQTVTLQLEGGHLALPFDAERCQHPAITQRKRLELQGQTIFDMDNNAVDQTEATELVAATVRWYNQLLAKKFGLFQTFSMVPWMAGFRGGGTKGTLTLDYNATVTLDPADTTTTIDQVATVMTNTTHMAWYVKVAVLPTSSPSFRGVTNATGTVKPRTLASIP